MTASLTHFEKLRQTTPITDIAKAERALAPLLQRGAAPGLEGLVAFREAMRTPAHPLQVGNNLLASPYVLMRQVFRDLPNPYDLEAVSRHPLVKNFSYALKELLLDERVVGAMNRPVKAPAYVTENVKSLIKVAWHFTITETQGEHVYELSYGLGTRFLNTELHGITTDDLRLPFKNCYFVIPEALGLNVSNSDTGSHPLVGLYVTESTNPHGDPRWDFLAYGPTRNPTANPHDDAIFHFTVALPPGAPIDDVMKFVWMSPDAPVLPTTREYFEATAPRMFKFLMNAVVYITMSDAELRETLNPRYAELRDRVQKHPKGSPKRARAAQELAATPQQRRILVGASYKPLEEDKESIATGRTTRVRTLVAGHWRNQPHGEGRVLRKMIFIEPHWRGGLELPVSEPRRVVGKDTL